MVRVSRAGEVYVGRADSAQVGVNAGGGVQASCFPDSPPINALR